MTQNTDIPKGAVSKDSLCQMYGISAGTLRRLLNEKYFHQLQELGYKKEDKLLSPKQFSLFCSLYGEP